MSPAATPENVGRLVASCAIGAVIGFVAAILLFLPTCFIAAIKTDSEQRAEAIANSLVWILPLVGAAIGLLAGIVHNGIEIKKARIEEEQRYAADVASRESAARATRLETERKLGQLREICKRAEESALGLARSAGQAALAVADAESKLRACYYALFWHSLANGTVHLLRYLEYVAEIEDAMDRYAEKRALLASAPSFSIESNELPDPSAQSDRLRTLFQEIQQDPAQVNSYLLFRFPEPQLLEQCNVHSWGEAIQVLPERIRTSTHRLGQQITVVWKEVSTSGSP